MIAALYVDPRGSYANLPGVDPWDEKRDARLYDGPWPVVAHPPCQRWCRLAGLVEARWGHKRGDDGGTFAAALAAVRRFGGVLEHPAYSDAWGAFNLPRPDRHGGWCGPDAHGGFSCHVEQCRYGHKAKKATWLYACLIVLPSMRWGSDPDPKVTHTVSWCGNRVDSASLRPRLTKREAIGTPPEFREALLAMARTSVVLVSRDGDVRD